jgi:hypothetical protein
MTDTITWHRCDEANPPARTRLLTYEPEAPKGRRINIGVWDCKDHGKGNMVWGWYISRGGIYTSSPTHWAYLPDAPTK